MKNNKVEIRYRGAVHKVESGIRVDDVIVDPDSLAQKVNFEFTRI